MSNSVAFDTTVVPCRSLGEYVTLLLSRLEAEEPAAAARIRDAVGDRSACLTLDDERVEVRFEGSQLVVRSTLNTDQDGSGLTSRAATLDLIGGYLEVTDAVLDGRLDLIGTIDDIAAIGQAIEMLIDGSSRVPGLQRLARDFWVEPCRPKVEARALGPVARRTAFYPDPPGQDERELLARLNLLR
jgi:hypothetical protein